MTNGPYCYSYDAFGLRVEKAHANGGTCSGTVTVDKLYWRSIWADAIAETDGSGSTTNSAYKEYVFFAGRRIASRDGLGNIYYYYTDHLGTTRSSGAPPLVLSLVEGWGTPGEGNHTGSIPISDCPFWL